MSVCTAVIWASSGVSLSSLYSTASMSLSPNSFFLNFFSRPCLICLVATASVEITCINILTIISVMQVVRGIFV
ncbi:hypothetical protein BJV74DRAFT_865314 [Russula compacta]|nr:hypothetical protein BJV74DRAFT_865314 [Russula compacta]